MSDYDGMSLKEALAVIWRSFFGFVSKYYSVGVVLILWLGVPTALTQLLVIGPNNTPPDLVEYTSPIVGNYEDLVEEATLDPLIRYEVFVDLFGKEHLFEVPTDYLLGMQSVENLGGTQEVFVDVLCYGSLVLEAQTSTSCVLVLLRRGYDVGFYSLIPIPDVENEKPTLLQEVLFDTISTHRDSSGTLLLTFELQKSDKSPGYGKYQSNAIALWLSFFLILGVVRLVYYGFGLY